MTLQGYNDGSRYSFDELRARDVLISHGRREGFIYAECRVSANNSEVVKKWLHDGAMGKEG